MENDEIEKSSFHTRAVERDRIMNKVRSILETGKGERLNTGEIETLKEIAGVYYIAYIKAIDHIDSKNKGGKNYESQITR